MPNVPNLDCMTQEELMAFWMRYQNRQKRADALALVGPRKGYTKVAASLGAYAANKATAMACRVRGDIQAAQCYEQICESIYSGLPEDCRWLPLDGSKHRHYLTTCNKRPAR